MFSRSIDGPLTASPRAIHPSRARPPGQILVLSFAILLASCGDEVTITPSPVSPSPIQPSHASATATPSASISQTPDPLPLESPPVLSFDEVPLMCGSPLAFSADALRTAPGAEQADHPAARSLRSLLDDGSLPARSGWRLVVFSENGALFLLPGTRSEGVTFWNAEIGPIEEGWRPVRWGQCEIQPTFDGIEAARWELSPGEVVGPDTVTFEVLVFEQACASGASPEGRIVGPAIVPLDDSIIVILGTTPPPGPQSCEPGPPANIRVQLPVPLGDRHLFDGSTFPAEPRN